MKVLGLGCSSISFQHRLLFERHTPPTSGTQPFRMHSPLSRALLDIDQKDCHFRAFHYNIKAASVCFSSASLVFGESLVDIGKTHPHPHPYTIQIFTQQGIEHIHQTSQPVTSLSCTTHSLECGRHRSPSTLKHHPQTVTVMIEIH